MIRAGYMCALFLLLFQAVLLLGRIVEAVEIIAEIMQEQTTPLAEVDDDWT